jgi:hypothetical protein
MEIIYPFQKPYKKPSYFLGLLCLIPLAGIVFGIIFLYKGIFRFKDKYFIIIGAVGLVFNIYVCGQLYYQLHDLYSKTPFVSLSQGDLNSLVKHIEFYKVQYGAYPDSLEQLRKDGSIVTIEDVLLQIDQRKNNKFYYGRVKNKYYLFSSGLDKIPNTSDDLYPTINISDSSKFGWIKVENADNRQLYLN